MLDLPPTSSSINIGKLQIWGSNHQELIGLKKEIFGQSRYFVDLDTLSPRIIDGGAHVGVASIFFKSRWPKAHITCVEPLPENLRYLSYNLWHNRLDDIIVIPAALAEQAGERTLYFDKTEDRWFSTASFEEGAWNHQQQSAAIKVSTITLDSLITEPIDLLKLDVEGAEEIIIRSCQKLNQIKNIIIEFHPQNNPKNFEKIFKNTHHLEIVNHHYGLKLWYLSKK